MYLITYMCIFSHTHTRTYVHLGMLCWGLSWKPAGMNLVISLLTNKDLCSLVLFQVLMPEYLFLGFFFVILRVRNFSKGGVGLCLILFLKREKSFPFSLF